MSTTTLLVEILIIGFEVILWLLLGLALFPGARWIQPLLGLDNKNAFIAAGALAAAAYVLGIVADKTAKWVVELSSLAFLFRFKPKKPWWQRTKPASRTTALLEWLLRPYAVTEAGGGNIASVKETLEKYSAVVVKVGEPMSDLLYGRSKVRILRASIFNAPLVALLAAAHGMLAVLRLPDECTLAFGPWILSLPWWVRIFVAGVKIYAVGVAGIVLAWLSARYFNWLYCYNLQLFQDRLNHFYHHTRRGRSRAFVELTVGSRDD